MSEPDWIPQAERDGLPGYIAECQRVLRLADWTIVLSESPADDEAYANCKPCEGRKLATIRISRDWTTLAPAVKRHTIAHELIHCQFAHASDVVRMDTGKHLAQSTYDMLWNSFLRNLEYGVDAMADAVAGFLPEYPTW